MLSLEQAKSAAKAIDGTYARPGVKDKATGEVITEPRGRQRARVGGHVTNGERRHVVHVTATDKSEAPFTVSSAHQPGFPLANE